jgi:hypothetical protein
MESQTFERRSFTIGKDLLRIESPVHAHYVANSPVCLNWLNSSFALAISENRGARVAFSLRKSHLAQ